jgi:uncharacterized membrane protein YbhN (UPF0104 family)
MGISKSQRINLAIILILTALGFMFWLFCPFSLWSILRLVGCPVNFWAMTESLSTAVTAAAVLSAGFIAYRELKSQDMDRYIEVAY